MEKYLRYEKNTFPLFEYTDESGQETVCNVQLFPYSKGRVMAWVRDYPGAAVSVSTSAPSLRDAICKEFKIAPEKLLLIEWVPKYRDKIHPDALIRDPVSPFYTIEFTDDGPQWQPLAAEGCADMCLQVFIGYRERNPLPTDKDISSMSPFGTRSET